MCRVDSRSYHSRSVATIPLGMGMTKAVMPKGATSRVHLPGQIPGGVVGRAEGNPSWGQEGLHLLLTLPLTNGHAY